jgi:hypothetical protein
MNAIKELEVPNVLHEQIALRRLKPGHAPRIHWPRPRRLVGLAARALRWCAAWLEPVELVRQVAPDRPPIPRSEWEKPGMPPGPQLPWA